MGLILSWSVKAKMQSDLSSDGKDHLDGIESQEVDASSELSVCLLVLSFYLALWNADVKLEKQGLWYLTLFSWPTNLNMSITSMLP